MSELITNKAGTYSVPCFGQHVADHAECVKCPLARDCLVVKDAKLKESARESLEKIQSAPLNASYLVFQDCPDLPQSSIISAGPGLCCNTSSNSFDLKLNKIPGLNPGFYDKPCITVDEFGRITNVYTDSSSSATSFVYNSSGVMPLQGQILKHNGTCWDPGYETPPGISNIRDADDYDNIAPPRKGQVIAWDGFHYTPTDPELAQSKVSGKIVASGRTEITNTPRYILYTDLDNEYSGAGVQWTDKPGHLIEYSIECLSEPPNHWISATYENGFCFEMQFQPNNPVYLHWVTRNV